LGERRIAVREFSVDAFCIGCLSSAAAEDRRDLVLLADFAIGVESRSPSLPSAARQQKTRFVAELGLGEEQLMMAAGVFSLVGGAERRKAGEHFSPQAREIARA
jgi:hypothetical protein